MLIGIIVSKIPDMNDKSVFVGMYRHPNGTIGFFVDDVKTTSNKIDIWNTVQKENNKKYIYKEILVENIPLVKEHFLLMSPFLQDFKEFQPKYSPFKRNFPKVDANLAPKWRFLGGFVKNIPLAKDLGRKIYPWLRNFCKKIHPWLRDLGSKSDPWERHTPSKVHNNKCVQHFPGYWPFVRGIHRWPMTRSLQRMFLCQTVLAYQQVRWQSWAAIEGRDK